MNYLTNYYKNLCEQLQYKATKVEHLIESIIDDGGDGLGGPNDMRGRNRVPPGSIPPPKLPPPTRLSPFEILDLPPGHDRPIGPGLLPQEIDYEDIQRQIRDLEERIRSLVRNQESTGIEDLRAWLFRTYGIRLPWPIELGTAMYTLWRELMFKWMQQYPNISKEQWKNLQYQYYKLWPRLTDIWDDALRRRRPPPTTPSTLEPDSAPRGPSQRDRERGFERWDRENY
jgi:hypothetical protein